MIDSYSFGRISINQKTYVKDVIILPDRIQENWWRKEGHLLQLEDIESAVEEADPEIVVVGRGKFGVMKVSSEVGEYLQNKNILLHVEESAKAVKKFNQLTAAGKRVLGAFHLTC
jgi:hypothetical protein